MKTKLKSILAVALCAVGLAASAAEPVPYLDWNAAKKQLVEVSITDYAVYKGEATLAAGTTYVVNKGGTITDRITVNGTAENPTRLILCDGVTFNIQKGITVYAKDATTNALVICGQKLGTGALVVAYTTGNSAGIGGYYPTPVSAPCGGIITINGGTVTVNGGGNGAGIGGGPGGTGGHVTINGGTVTATGGMKSAGIGGGSGGAGGTVTINGGTVTVKGGEVSGAGNCAGIGGGYNAANGGALTFGDSFKGTVLAGADEESAVFMTTAAYAAKHSAAYAAMPKCKLQLPAPEYYTCVVSNETAELNGTLADGMNTYAVATGATVKVYFVLGTDCVWADESFDNPKTIAGIVSDTVVDAKDLPKANPVLGTKTYPYDIGGGATAWPNGTELVIGGAGEMGSLSEVAGLKDLLAGFKSVKIDSNGVTGAVKDAFKGLTEPVALTLPAGWQGGMPEDGYMFGVKLDMGAFVIPTAIKNVRFQQRYPWNGKLDITCDLTGSGEIRLVVSALRNGVWLCEATAITGETVFDLNALGCVTNGVKLIWDAAKDMPGFKAQDLTVEVTAENMSLPGVQLWRDGPYFETYNVGATEKKPEEFGYYFWWGDTVGYVRNGSSWDAVDGSVTGFKFVNNKEIFPAYYGKSVEWMKLKGWLDDNGNLAPAHDAATAYHGAPWRMMTFDEQKALVQNCKVEKATVGGVAGVRITGKTFTNKSIFLPMAGFGDGSDFNTTKGYYWSGTPSPSSPTLVSYACDIYIGTGSTSFFNASGDIELVYNGCPVRAVRDPQFVRASATGMVDLTVGDRLIKDEETLVVDPAWYGVESATVSIMEEEFPRTYTCASNDLWQTAKLWPGRRYVLSLTAGENSEGAAFWKPSPDWEVLDNSRITADKTFKSGKTYLVLGKNVVSGGVTLTVEDGVEFIYDERAPAGFSGGRGVELPKIRETVTVEGGLYQIVEKIKGCQDNPWEIGAPTAADVTAYTNGTEFVIEGAGDKMMDFTAENPAPWGTGITSITVDVTSSLLALGANALSGCDAIDVIYVPYGTGKDYKEAAGWSAYADKIVEKGSKDTPLTNGADLTAYIDNGTLVIGGTGTVDSLSAAMGASWNNVKTDIEAITITEETLTIESDDVFEGVKNLKLTLPSGWQSGLPDEEGNWYGAKVDMTSFVYPFTVKNMKVLPRYPWDRLVDVTFDVAGTGTVAVVVQVTANGVELANPTMTGETTFDFGTGGESKNQKLIWNAKADFGDEGVHEKIQVTLSVEPKLK